MRAHGRGVSQRVAGERCKGGRGGVNELKGQAVAADTPCRYRKGTDRDVVNCVRGDAGYLYREGAASIIDDGGLQQVIASVIDRDVRAEPLGVGGSGGYREQLRSA